MCASIEKRDVSNPVPAVEVTSESFLKSLQKGVESVFSSDNADVSVDALSEQFTDWTFIRKRKQPSAT